MIAWFLWCAAFGYWVERAQECGMQHLCHDPVAWAAVFLSMLGPVGAFFYWLVSESLEERPGR